jgi:hypothetical protein
MNFQRPTAPDPIPMAEMVDEPRIDRALVIVGTIWFLPLAFSIIFFLLSLGNSAWLDCWLVLHNGPTALLLSQANSNNLGFYFAMPIILDLAFIFACYRYYRKQTSGIIFGLYFFVGIWYFSGIAVFLSRITFG